MARALLRIVAQVLLTGPLVIFYPFLAVGTAMTLGAVFTEPEVAANGLMLVAGFLGLTSLYLSIFLPLPWIRAHAWLRHGLAACMVLGIVLAGFFLIAGADAALKMDTGTWMFAGPVVVAFWNLWRMYSPLKASVLPDEVAAAGR